MALYIVKPNRRIRKGGKWYLPGDVIELSEKEFKRLGFMVESNQLMGKTRAELEAMAVQLGIPDPKQMPNKEALVKAIIEAGEAKDA
jgi:hypothetical protein